MSSSPESHLSMILYFFCAHLLARFWSGALQSPLSLVWQNSKREQNDAEIALCVYVSNGMFMLDADEHLPAEMIPIAKHCKADATSHQRSVTQMSLQCGPPLVKLFISNLMYLIQI